MRQDCQLLCVMEMCRQEITIRRLTCLTNFFIQFLLTEVLTYHLQAQQTLQIIITLSNILISQEEVQNSLVVLDLSKAMGLYNVRPRVLKGCAISLYSMLHTYFLCTLCSAKFYMIGDFTKQFPSTSQRIEHIEKTIGPLVS